MSKLRRGRRTTSRRNTRLSVEESKTRQQNKAKLAAFLAAEKTIECKTVSAFLSLVPPEQMIQANSILVPVVVFADPVIQIFHSRISKSVRILAADFDPKAEYDTFIAAYVRRFDKSVPMKRNPIKKSRKGVGGTKESPLTLAVKVVLEEAAAVNEELNFALMVDRTWEKLYPGKDKSRLKSKFTVHKRDVRERLSRLAPHLLPSNKSKKPKS